MAEVSRHTSEPVNAINIFHNVNSILYTAHPMMAKILLKVINVFRGECLALFTVTSIRKSTKNRNSETRRNPKDGKEKKIQG